MESRRITVSLLQINMNNIMIMITYGMNRRFTLINFKMLYLGIRPCNVYLQYRSQAQKNIEAVCIQ